MKIDIPYCDSAYEPKRNNRFVVRLPELFDIQEWMVSTCTYPKYSFTNNKWEDIIISFRDPIYPSTSDKLYHLMKKIQKGITFDESITIETLDPCGVTVEKWNIEISKILSINFGEGNYGDDNMKTLHLHIQPKECRLVWAEWEHVVL